MNEILLNNKKKCIKLYTIVTGVILALILAASAAIYLYADITDTYDNSILFLEALFSGNLRNFYSFSIEHNQAFWAANYDSLIYVVYGIWNLPVFLYCRVTGANHMLLPAGLFWCKMLGIIFTFLSAVLIGKILKIGGKDRETQRLGGLLYLTSMTTYLLVFVIAQVDGFALFLILLGFYYYQKEDFARFVLSFAVAMPTKMFGFFLFLPLVLLFEKRIFRVVLYLVCGFVGSILSRMVFGQDAAYHFALGAQSRDAVLQIADSRFYPGHQLIPFVVLYMGVCCFCYLYKGARNEKRYDINTYVAFAVWASFIAFVDFNSYWGLYLMPFLAIHIFQNGRFLKCSVLLELLFSIGFLGNLVFYCYPLTDNKLTHRLFLDMLPGVTSYDAAKYGSPLNMAVAKGLDIYAPYFTSLMVGSLILLAVLTCPFLFHNQKEHEQFDKSLIVGRGISLLLVFAWILYACELPAPRTIYTSLEGNKALCQAEILTEPNVLKQSFTVQEDGSLHELELYFQNDYYKRNNFCSIMVALLDSEGNPFFAKRIGVNGIQTDKRVIVDLKNCPVQASKVYTIMIHGIPGDLMDRISGRHLYIYETETLLNSEFPLLINEKPEKANLYFRIR